MAKANNSARIKWLEQLRLVEAETHWQLSAPALVEHALHAQEGMFSEEGALVCSTGKLTGRSPQDKFIVEDQTTAEKVAWGAMNNPLSSQKFKAIYDRLINFLQHKRLYIRDCYVNNLPSCRLSLRVVTTKAWQNLFAHHLFLRPTEAELATLVPNFLVIQVPEFLAEPAKDGTNNTNFTIINITKKIILIGGTGYAGEMKKAVFTLLNYLLPVEHGILPMHCAANVGEAGDTALFFGLSGTGKTTLSAAPNRQLIGDDEHGWYSDGVFNFEGGCYAKTIGLTPAGEPKIFNAIKFGTIIENMRFQPDTRKLNYQDASITENTRAAYPLDYIDEIFPAPIGEVPKNIFLLTCDAYGVLPPIAKLTPEQIVYYFLLGYTAKIAGTEKNITTPKVVFSTCFGAPFLPLPAVQYAALLIKRLEENPATAWLVNTGWVRGPYGEGSRIALNYTRAMVDAALSGTLDKIGFIKESAFDLFIPKSCPGVPVDLLNPIENWKDKKRYEMESAKLCQVFESNFKSYEYQLDEQARKDKRYGSST